MIALFAYLAAYLLGSIPFGFLAGKVRGMDMRKVGSGNIGATNVYRTLGRKWGYAVFSLDFLKGAAAVVIGVLLAETEFAAVVCGVLAILGHNFPVWLRFKGGKGIATSAGVIVALFPLVPFLVGVGVWIILFYVTRYVSVASIFGSIALSVVMLIFLVMGKTSVLLFIVSCFMTSLAIWRHRPNIRRLLEGTEPRIESKRKSAVTGHGKQI